MDQLTAIILAGGKGTRMKSVDRNKVSLHVSGEPILKRTIAILEKSGIEKIIVVVGFAKESVLEILNNNILIAEQKEQLGTGHAVECALPKIPDNSKDVLIIYGDDAFLHTPETFKNLYKIHKENNSAITFITMDSEDPKGFGRIIRGNNNAIKGIVEEKNATEQERKIQEINLGCYIVDKRYLKKNIKNIKKNDVTGEYYITDLIDIVAQQNGKISAYKLKDIDWKGVNTPQDLQEAEMIFAKNG